MRAEGGGGRPGRGQRPFGPLWGRGRGDSFAPDGGPSRMRTSVVFPKGVGETKLYIPGHETDSCIIALGAIPCTPCALGEAGQGLDWELKIALWAVDDRLINESRPKLLHSS